MFRAYLLLIIRR